MGKIAVLFSGQGAQKAGMGKDIYEADAGARMLFEKFEQIRPGTIQMCFSGTAEQLAQTINTQPCLYAVEAVLATAFKEYCKKQDITISGTAGFSLGEIAALWFGGVYDCTTGFNTVIKRAQLMQRCTEMTNGAMAACLKLTAGQIQKIADEFDQIYPVNYNSPLQTVVAGEKQQLAQFAEKVKAAGGRAVILAVGGGFHCPFMNDAEQGLADVVSLLPLQTPKIPVYANYNAKPYASDRKEIVNTVSRQVNHPVEWQKTIETMIADGFDTFIEIGAGKTLAGLITKINPDVKTAYIEDSVTLSAVCQTLSQKIE